MHYSYEFTVETSHIATAPLIEEMKLATGRLRHVEIEFLAGCNRHVRCFIADRAAQILPTNQEGFYAANGRSIPINCYIDIPTENNLLYFYGWNVDADWNHVIGVELDVEGPDEPNVFRVLESFQNLMERFVELLRGIF